MGLKLLQKHNFLCYIFHLEHRFFPILHLPPLHYMG